MALPTTPKQCDIKIVSLKKQIVAMTARKKKLAEVAKKAAAKKKVAPKKKAPVKKKK